MLLAAMESDGSADGEVESLFNYTQQPACKRPKHKTVSPKQLAKSLRRRWGLSASICKVLEGQYCPNWFTTAIHFTVLTHNLSLNNCYLKKDTYDFFVALYWELTKLSYNRYFLLLIEPQCHFVELFIWHQIFRALSCTCRSMSVFKELRQVICNPFQSSPSSTYLHLHLFLWFFSLANCYFTVSHFSVWKRNITQATGTGNLGMTNS